MHSVHLFNDFTAMAYKAKYGAFEGQQIKILSRWNISNSFSTNKIR